MKLVIDHEACTGHGRCYALAPDLIEDDDDGYGQVRDNGEVTELMLPTGQAAVRACPEQAVHFEPSPS
jgi:ferredoxin